MDDQIKVEPRDIEQVEEFGKVCQREASSSPEAYIMVVNNKNRIIDLLKKLQKIEAKTATNGVKKKKETVKEK